MFTDEQRLGAGECYNLSAKQSEFAIPDHCDTICFRDRGTFENAARGGEWFSEHRLFVGNILRNGNEIHVWQLQKLGVRTVSTDDPQHSASRAVSRITGTTQIATSASGVDLSHHALSNQLASAALFNDSDELVSDRSIEPRIPARDFQIRVANARQQHAHQRLIRIVRFLDLAKFELLFFYAEGEH